MSYQGLWIGHDSVDLLTPRCYSIRRQQPTSTLSDDNKSALVTSSTKPSSSNGDGIKQSQIAEDPRSQAIDVGNNQDDDDEAEANDDDDDFSSFKSIKSSLFSLVEHPKGGNNQMMSANTNSGPSKTSGRKSSHRLFYAMDTEVELGHDNPGEQKLIRDLDGRQQPTAKSSSNAYKHAKAKYNEVFNKCS